MRLKILEPDYYKDVFFKTYNPYISHSFISVNQKKVDRLLYLANSETKPDLGLVLGVRNNELISPFSAPFGGFHYRHEMIYSDEIQSFIDAVKMFFFESDFKKLTITMPPFIYSTNMNAKLISAFFRFDYDLEVADITNYIPLNNVGEKYTDRTAREYYTQALKHKLQFEKVVSDDEVKMCYEIIKDNRARLHRPIFMTLMDLENMQQLWAVDYFLVRDADGLAVSSAIFYRAHGEIVQAVLWGDSQSGRLLRAMDYMIFELCQYYKKMQYLFIDLGVSTEVGVPNNGLLRFKETHGGYSDVRYSFSLNK